MRKIPIMLILAAAVLLPPHHARCENAAGRTFFDLGVFSYEDGAFDDALTQFQNALGAEPGNPLYNQFMGKTCLKTGDYDAARIYLEKARQADPDLPELRYDLGLLSYHTGHYAQGAAFFRQALERDPDHVLAAYYTGICLFRQKQYAQALPYFVDASEKSPSVKANSSYYAGICRYKTGNTALAVENLKYAATRGESISLRDAAARALEGLAQQDPTLKDYRIFLKITGLYDDNVRLEPLDVDVYTDEEDQAMEAFFLFRKTLVSREKNIIGAGFSFYRTWHAELSDYDLTGTRLHLYARYLFSDITLGMNYFPAYYWLDGENYMMRHELKPDITWRIAENLYWKASLSWHNNEYFDDGDRDGDAGAWFTDFLYALPENRGYIFAGGGFTKNAASHPDHDYDQWTGRAGASFDLPWNINLSLTGKYQDRGYENADSLYGVKRNDEKYAGGISVSRPVFYDWLTCTAQYNYTENDSNIKDYRYRRNMISVALAASF